MDIFYCVCISLNQGLNTSNQLNICEKTEFFETQQRCRIGVTPADMDIYETKSSNK